MKKRFLLENLDCPNCANKLERKINTINELHSASIDFMSLSLFIECEENDLELIIEKIRKIISDLEPDVILKDYKKIKKKHHHEEHKHHHDHECGCAHHKEQEHHHDYECGCAHHKEHEHHHDHECGCAHHEEHKHKKKKHFSLSKLILNRNVKIVSMIIAFVLFLIPTIFSLNETLELVIYILAYLFVGLEVLYKSFKNILKGEIFDENFLMSIATIVAFIIGEYIEAFAVMFLYQIGETLQDYAVNKSRKSISSILALKVNKANLLLDNEIQEIDAEEIEIGDILLVKVGEQIPTDGVIIEGECSLDTSNLTGESVLVNKQVGDEVLSGTINKSGVIKIRATSGFEDSTFAKILDLVENATASKASSEKFITKFAKIYTPAVVLLAVLIALLPWTFGGDITVWSYRACVFLVTSCPCALVISVPLSYFIGIGKASKEGLLIKGSNYLEMLNKVKSIYFDKTGTLTKGSFIVSEAKGINISDKELINIAASVEVLSTHPIALSILKVANIPLDVNQVSLFNEVTGKGVEGTINEDLIKVGTYEYLNLPIEKITDKIGTIIYVSKNNEYQGYLVIQDEIKDDAKEAILNLNAIGLNTIMLTGDNDLVAKDVATKVEINNYYASLLPEDKVKIIKEDKELKVFVGDGVNDAPSLVSADVGIAMGALGSDAAIESSDIVLMKDNLSSLKSLFKIAFKTNKIVKQNIVFSLFIKVVIMVLGALGIAPLWLAVFADVGVTLLAVLNSLRINRI